MIIRSLVTVLVLTLVAATGCGSAAQSPAIAAPADDRPVDPAPVGERAVVIQHGPMTYVMDTLPNQVQKARAALEESALVAQLTSAGIAVTYVGDESLGDVVIVVAGDHELGRAELRELDDQPAPAALLDAIHAHFGDPR